MSEANLARLYEQSGYYFPITAFSSDQAKAYRQQYEQVESKFRSSEDSADSRLWFTHANHLLPFVDTITRSPLILEAVSQILGPNILVWNASFFIKEPHTPDFVSWHQDLTYWGLTHFDEVTAWVALSPATVQSGCMRFVAGSHKHDILEHKDTFDDSNLLSRGQVLAVDIDESQATEVELQPGQVSLHHGKLFHASHPNQSADRRIGLAIRYVTPEMGQRDGQKPYAHLVSGEDNVGNFRLLEPPKSVMDPSDIEIARENTKIGEKFFYENAEQSGRALS